MLSQLGTCDVNQMKEMVGICLRQTDNISEHLQQENFGLATTPVNRRPEKEKKKNITCKE